MRLSPTLVAARVIALALLVGGAPASAEQGILFSGYRAEGWGLWFKPETAPARLIREGEVRGAVARAGWLAFSDPAGTIFVGSTAEGEPSAVVDLPEPCGQPSLAPDGSALVVACFRFADRQDDGALYLVGLPDRVVTPLFDGPGLQKSPVFSPDGRHIAFVSGFRLNAERVIEHLWLINSDGTDARALADESDVNIDVDWLDAETVVFASDRGGDGVRIWQAAIGDEPMTALTAGPSDMETAAAADGRIAFVGLSGDAFRLMVRDPASAGMSQIVAVTDADGFTAAHDPSWTEEY